VTFLLTFLDTSVLCNWSIYLCKYDYTYKETS